MFVLLGIFVLCLAAFFASPKYFKGDEKLVLVVAEEENIDVVVFDPVNREVTNVLIPASTLVSASRNLGNWRIGSLWELGKNEKLAGRLLTESIVKNFYAPAAFWASSSASDFVRGKKSGILHFVFGRIETNLTLIDRIKLSFFLVGIKDYNRNVLDLSETSFLERKILPDGANGYVVTGNMPQKLLVLFADDKLAGSNAKVSITNSSGNLSIANRLGGIVEAMGAKVVLVREEEEEDSDCTISALDRKVVGKLMAVFSCDFKKQENEDSDRSKIDIDIKIGKKFLQRF